MELAARFERLVMPHLAAAYNLAYWLVRSRTDAEDVVQEALMRAFRAFSGFDGTSIRPWFFAIVRNTAYTWLANRHQSTNLISLDQAFARHPDDEDGEAEIPLDEPSAEDRLIQAADRELVLDALSELSPIYREILVLREIEGLGYREIGEITGTAAGTVMSRLSRGRNELRKILLTKMAPGHANAVR